MEQLQTLSVTKFKWEIPKESIVVSSKAKQYVWGKGGLYRKCNAGRVSRDNWRQTVQIRWDIICQTTAPNYLRLEKSV